MSIKNIIFDLDGVLVDSEPMYWLRMQQFTEHYGLKLTRDESLSMVGSAFSQDLKFLSEKFEGKYSPDELGAKYREFAKASSEDFPKYSDVLMPYVRFILPKFKAMHLKLAIASASSQEQIERAIRGCGLVGYFDLYVSGNEFKRSKPDPEIYLTTLERLGAKTSESIVIEDSTYGIEAAKRAGLQVIARIDDRFTFDQTKADFRVGSLYEAYFLIKDLIASSSKGHFNQHT